eukprot:GDKI01028524.1.p1 GENE.GDKI01028524.1~~GDKI01028524.1.p1  ORF type:complete len:112 (-),score=32.43 GDKI01028524.1:5-340(-)
MTSCLAPVHLFGGAFSCSLPPSFKDVSAIREVPDHQEVFADTATDCSLMVEILQPAPVPDAEAVGFHFEDLASANDALERRLFEQRVVGGAERQTTAPLISEEFPGCVCVS